MVIGENEKHPAAFIVPDFLYLKDWCKNNNISYSDSEQIIRDPKVLEIFESEVTKYNEKFSQFERIKKFVLIGKAWSPDGGELTATLKLKRRNILEKYSNLYNKIFEKNG